jgi:hypothetical protein
MSGVLGGSVGSFVGLTVLMFGFAALLTGQAIADNWRPAWQAIVASFGLAAAARFLTFSLFEGQLLSLSGFVIAWAYLAAIAFFAWRATLARKMVRQYPWLYEPAGLLGWRRIDGGQGTD